MARGPEARIQDRIVKMFRSRGWLAQKNSAGAGWPDFTFISPTAHILFAEFKAPGASLRPIQEAWIRDMRKRCTSGCSPEIVVWDDTGQAYAYLEKYHRYAGPF